MRLVDRIKAEACAEVALPSPNQVDSRFVLECLTTDSEGDGILFAALLGNKLLYAASTGSWYLWAGHRWMRDTRQQVLGLVRYVTERYGQEILALEERIERSKQENDEEDHKVFARAWTKKIEQLDKKIRALRQDTGRNACIKFACTHLDNPFAIEGTEFDKDPWLLGVKNGVVDLRSGMLLAGDPGQLISKQCAVAYDPNLDTSEWEQFLLEIYDHDQELVDFMQILLGYGITGHTTEHIFPFLIGRGRNGKSLFINQVVRVLGDYAAVVPCELFLKNNQPRASNQTDPGIMKLEGLRIAMSSEVEEGAKFSAQQVKRITGGDRLEGRNPYDRELRNFEPTHLVMMIGNHEPVPPTGDPAFWDRTWLIQHPVRFVKGDPDPAKNERPADPHIEERLAAMAEQCLTWMVMGTMRWIAAGRKIIPPQSVLKSTADYQTDTDWIGQYLDACCERADVTTGSTSLYVAFCRWYQDQVNANKKMTPTHRSFALKLKGRGEFRQERKADGVYYHGLQLNAIWRQRMLDEAFAGYGE